METWEISPFMNLLSFTFRKYANIDMEKTWKLSFTNFSKMVFNNSIFNMLSYV